MIIQDHKKKCRCQKTYPYKYFHKILSFSAKMNENSFQTKCRRNFERLLFSCLRNFCDLCFALQVDQNQSQKNHSGGCKTTMQTLKDESRSFRPNINQHYCFYAAKQHSKTWSKYNGLTRSTKHSPLTFGTCAHQLLHFFVIAFYLLISDPTQEVHLTPQ